MKCEECLDYESTVLCIECDQALCKTCDECLHKGGKRISHTRPRVCYKCKNQAIYQCIECNLILCQSCEYFHSGHSMQSLSYSSRSGVFWDIFSCRPKKSEDIFSMLTEIKEKLGRPEFIKAYGEQSSTWNDTLTQHNIQSVSKSGIKIYEGLLLDLSISLNTGLTHILVISNQIQSFLPHLMQLKSSSPAVEIWTSSNIFLSQINRILSDDNNKVKLSLTDSILNYLKEESSKGNLISDIKDTISILSLKLKTDQDSIIDAIQALEKRNQVYIVKKQFDRIIVNLISLKVEALNIETLIWTLKSLCVDEMLPSEKAIQARIKEAFDLKPSQAEWNILISQAKGHSHSSSAPEFSFFSRPLSQPRFIFKEKIDRVNNENILLIYLSGGSWIAFDSNSKTEDDLGLIGSNEWNEFILCLKRFFEVKGIKRQMKDDVKSMPGGKYGCAQFLKFCGSPQLKKCSLGKLSHYVQVAINEDILRYQRTMIVWSMNKSSCLPKHELENRLQIIKSAITSVLQKHEQGVSLAQLPLYIKHKINFSLNIPELGFPKLKDLLATFPEFQIEFRDSKHPFITLSKNIDFHQTMENIILNLVRLVNKSDFGIEVKRLEFQLFEYFGKLDWNIYNVSNIIEFMQTYAKEKFDIINSSNTFIVFLQKPGQYSYLHEYSLDKSLDLFSDGNPSPNIMHYSSLSTESQDFQKIVNISALPLDCSKEEEEAYFSDIINESGSTDFSYSLPRVNSRNNRVQKQESHQKIQSENFSKHFSYF